MAPDDVVAWRARERERLIAARLAMPAAARRAASAAITRALLDRFEPANPGLIGAYWPHRGEFDCRPLMRRIIALGGEVALPVAVRPRHPLEFRRWTPRASMIAGVAGIPHPAAGPPVRPTLLLVPTVGFDPLGYRLGYGAGYYDRTLAAFDERPTTFGLAFELGRLATIYPQAHDLPMDHIVTEAGILPRATRRNRGDVCATF